MGSLASILKQRRKELGLTLAQIADMMGVTEATVQRWESGNIKTLRHGKIGKLSEILDVHPASLMGWTDSADNFFPDNVFPIPASRSYPLVGDIACGTPILAEQNITEYVSFPGDLRADFCLRCRGDSMTGARIYDGDIVFVRQQPNVDDGEIAVVLIGEETTLKRVYRSEGILTLMPDNPAYPPMVYTGDQLDQIRILGKAVNFLSSVK